MRVAPRNTLILLIQQTFFFSVPTKFLPNSNQDANYYATEHL